MTATLVSATLSEDGVYRYSLERSWSLSIEPITFVMLNPSTADASKDDPTIRRCVGFAKAHGFGGIEVLNMFAYRATDPSLLLSAMRSGVDVVGGDVNDDLLSDRIRESGSRVVAAWGSLGGNVFSERAAVVRGMFRDDMPPLVLGLTKNGQPRHPLYVKSTTRFNDWTVSA